MSDIFDPAMLKGSLVSQFRRKTRARRETLQGIASASIDHAPRNDILPNLELSYILVAELKPSLRKLRKLDPLHVREIASSIQSLGFCAPILIGDGCELIDGEARFEAARQLGLERVPCIRISHLSKNEQRLLRLAVNRLAEKGQWDLETLKVELGELIIDAAPIEIAGFSSTEIDQILLADGADSLEPDVLPPDPTAEAVARIGDVFQLGPHRLVCGDAKDPETLRTLMSDGEMAQIIFTDEPFNVKIAGNVTGGAHREFAMASGEMSDAEFRAFNVAWMRTALAHLRDGGILATYIDWRGYPIVFSACSELALTPINLIVWVKSNGGMGSLYRSQHELLPLFKKGAAPHVNNIKLGKTGRWRSNVWRYPGASSLGSDARRQLEGHPTPKPTAMLEDALIDLTNRGDIVLDPFGGSASTLIAAENTGRVCRGVEIDPLYVDLSVRRYEAATKRRAVLIATGETLEQLAARRRIEKLG